jgi:N utilization substance protein B
LFEADQRGLRPEQVLQNALADGRVGPEDYARELVGGVAAHLGEIDAAIARAARGWSLQRMPAVDRTVLRLGVYELRYRPEVPAGVALDEAVRLAGDLSTDESAAFVNGVLASLLVDLTEGPDPDATGPATD